jgi:Zn-dependent protease
MHEIARNLAAISALLIVISIAIWANRLRGPLLQRLDGKRTSNAAPAATAIKLLMAALGISAVAAAFAIIGWISS